MRVGVVEKKELDGAASDEAGDVVVVKAVNVLEIPVQRQSISK